jgi:Ca2+-binding RTX toxin-like protein
MRLPLRHFAAPPLFALLALLLFAARGGTARAQTTECLGAVATIVGTDGADDIVGTNGPDVIVGLGGNDDIDGQAGDDRICGGTGLENMDGGLGTDLLDGGADADLVDGEEGNDRVDGGLARDILIGGPGDDNILGGPETGIPFDDDDFVSFLSAPGPVRVNLVDGRATGWGTDTLSSIETVSGSDFDDTLVGDERENNFWGNDGNDEFRGGGGSDRALFSKGVTANLVNGRAVGEGSDRLVSIEDLQGSLGDDRLIGNGGANSMNGGFGGRDTIVGAAGDDLLLAGGPSVLDGGAGKDLLGGWNERDQLLGGAGDDALLARDGDDLLSGGAGDDLLSGEEGNDTINGGGGVEDIADYLFSAAGVRVDLSRASSTGMGSDRLVGTEGILGSYYDDELVGDAKANVLFGVGGDDRIAGGAGADFLDGGGDRDELQPGGGVDYCLQDVSGCEISGVPEIPGEAPPPPGSRLSSHATATWRRAALPDMRELARERARVRAMELRGSMVGGRALATKLAPPTRDLFAASGDTAYFKYAAEPVCFTAQKPYATEIAPPRRVDPVSADGRPEQAWWQGMLYRAAKGGSYKLFRKTAWARADLSAVSAVPGVTIWKNTTGRRAFPSVVRLRVPTGRYVWKGNIYWTRSGGQVFEPVEPHIIRARTVRHHKHCDFK